VRGLKCLFQQHADAIRLLGDVTDGSKFRKQRLGVEKAKAFDRQKRFKVSVHSCISVTRNSITFRGWAHGQQLCTCPNSVNPTKRKLLVKSLRVSQGTAKFFRGFYSLQIYLLKIWKCLRNFIPEQMNIEASSKLWHLNVKVLRAVFPLSTRSILFFCALIDLSRFVCFDKHNTSHKAAKYSVSFSIRYVFFLIHVVPELKILWDFKYVFYFRLVIPE
jgi:hypothetical protein